MPRSPAGAYQAVHRRRAEVPVPPVAVLRVGLLVPQHCDIDGLGRGLGRCVDGRLREEARAVSLLHDPGRLLPVPRVCAHVDMGVHLSDHVPRRMLPDFVPGHQTVRVSDPRILGRVVGAADNHPVLAQPSGAAARRPVLLADGEK